MRRLEADFRNDLNADFEENEQDSTSLGVLKFDSLAYGVLKNPEAK